MINELTNLKQLEGIYPLTVNWVKKQLTTKDRKSGSVKNASALFLRWGRS